MNDQEQRESIDRRRFFRYVALTTIGVPAMKAASIAQQEAERWVNYRDSSYKDQTGKP